MFKNKWINVDEELPSCDGYYAVCGDWTLGVDYGFAWYDGYGFLYENGYRNPKFWKETETLMKRYGKIENK